MPDYQNDITLSPPDAIAETVATGIPATTITINSADGLPVIAETPLAGDFTASQTVGYGNTLITFNSTVSGGFPPYSYQWDLSDGDSSTDADPYKTFAVQDAHSISLVVADSVGNQVTITKTDYITINAPLNPLDADFSADVVIGFGTTLIQFTSTVSGGLAPYTYAWTLGNGDISTSANPGKSFSIAGEYTIGLTVTDSLGSIFPVSKTDYITIYPTPTPLVVNILASDTLGASPFEVFLVADVSGGQPPYSYSWTLGDGNTSTEEAIIHSYTTGTYSVSLTVTDLAGQEETVTETNLITVVTNAGELTAETAITPTSGYNPLEVAFASTVTGGAAPYSYQWNFGDGTTNTNQNVSKTYSSNGTFNVSLSVTDTLGTNRVIVYPSLITVSTQPPSTLLDLLSVAPVFCYSTKKRKANVTAAVRIRRASDNAETNIGFTAGTNNLDTTAIASFCGVSNGYLVQTFDQSGNNKYLYQSNTALQPLIYDSSQAIPYIRLTGTVSQSIPVSYTVPLNDSSPIHIVLRLAYFPGVNYGTGRFIGTDAFNSYAAISISASSASGWGFTGNPLVSGYSFPSFITSATALTKDIFYNISATWTRNITTGLTTGTALINNIQTATNSFTNANAAYNTYSSPSNLLKFNSTSLIYVQDCLLFNTALSNNDLTTIQETLANG